MLATSRVSNFGQAANGSVDVTGYTARFDQAAMSIATGIGTGNDIVEPTVLYDASAPFLGYEYVLCAAPYYQSNAVYENPTLWVSHDGTAWTPVVNGVPTVGGTPTALVASGVQGDGNNSDPTLYQGPDGTFYLLWNQALVATGSGGTGTGGNNWSVKASKASSLAGPWSTPVTLIASVLATTRPSSPSIFWDGSTWHMYAVDLTNTSSTAIVHYTNTSTDPTAGTWTPLSNPTVTLPAAGQVWWHLNAYRIGTTHVLILQDSQAGTSGGGNTWLASSVDGGVTWTVPDRPLIASTLSYRAALVVGHGGALDLFVGYQGSTWQLIRTTATRVKQAYGGVSSEGIPANAQAVALAKTPISPYKFGDTAIRTDSAVTPGTADSGQSYTVSTGTAGISSNQLYAAVAPCRAAAAVTGVADGVSTCEFSVVDTTAQQWLIIRYHDASNYVRIGYAATALYVMQNIVAGSVAQSASAAATFPKPTSGDVLAVFHHGAVISVYLNGAQIMRVTGWTSNASDSGIGFQVSTNTNPRFRNLTARALVGGA